MIAGGLAAQLSRVPISSDLCKLLIVASLAMLVCRQTRCPANLVLGFALFMSAGQAIVADRIDSQFVGDSLLTQVRIVDFPRATGNSVVMLVEPLHDQRLPRRSRVTWFEPTAEPSFGDVWQFELRLKRPRGHSNPGVFDAEAWLFRQKIHATGYVVSGKRNLRLAADTGDAIDQLRRRFVEHIHAATDSPETAAVLAAIGVGARHLISQAQWQNYAKSGTSHLMAISGLHIGLSATAAFLIAMTLLGLSRFSGNTYLPAILVGVLVAAAYAFVSGFGVPAQRAFVMLLVAAVVLIRRRRIDPVASVALAATLVFLTNPIATMTPGFFLSFLAVAVLLWFSRSQIPEVGSFGVARAVRRRVRQLLRMQVYLLFGLMPITVIVFQRIAFLAAPVNLVAIPLFSIVTVPFTLAGLVLSDTFSPLGGAALKTAAFSIELLELLVASAVSIPFADFTSNGLANYGWLVVVLPSLWVVLPKDWPGRKLSLLAVLILLVRAPTTPQAGCLDAHVLDVGQGLATVVQTRHKTLLFDTGASYRGGGSMAEQTILPFLKSRGIRRIDWLVISHADNDHSGGVTAIFRSMDVGMMLVGEPLRDSNLAASECAAGRRWHADGVGFRILHPDPSRPRVGNDASCVLQLEVGEHSMLLTGDIEAGGERDLANNSRLATVDVVVVPHHGSLTSSSPPFVAALSPTLAIVSAGHANRWGFPKKAVVARWQAVGATVLETASAGAVSLRLCAADGIRSLRKDRDERRRFWRSTSV